MMRTIPTLLIIAILFFNSVESSSHASSSSKGSGIVPPSAVKRIPRGPEEELIVHGKRGLVLTKANFGNHAVIPFKHSSEREFLQYKIMDAPHDGFEPFVVHPDRWMSDIGSHAIMYKNPWIFDSAYVVYLAEIRRRDEEYNHQLQAFRTSIKEHFMKLRRRH